MSRALSSRGQDLLLLLLSEAGEDRDSLSEELVDVDMERAEEELEVELGEALQVRLLEI